CAVRAPDSQPLLSPALFPLTDTATPEISTLSLHDALPIYGGPGVGGQRHRRRDVGHDSEVEDEQMRSDQRNRRIQFDDRRGRRRSEEHTSELQSRENLVCRLLLEKKKYKRRPQ